MTDMIRSACLTHFAELARASGLDPAEMVRKARLPAACIERQDLRIAVGAVRRLLEMSAEASGIETFGLRLAERGDLSSLGPVALMIRDQPTIGMALQTLCQFIQLHNEGMRVAIERHERIVSILFRLRGVALRQATELALGAIYRDIHFLSAGEWQPLDVHVMHPLPRSRQYHRKFFGCEVTFNSDFNGLICAADDMDRRIPLTHPRLARYVQRRVEELYSQDEGWDSKVAELVGKLLPSGDCRIERVAEYFACDRRTVHRRLAECGTSFSEIVEQERAGLVTRLITDRSKPLAGIAEQAGFSAQSALARWFRNRFGCSISQWRSDQQPGGRHRHPSTG
jgi:AraC-like DNA-binding protein